MSNAPQLVQKLWNYCNVLRDDGLSYGDYVEQLTFLLFLKMADEQSRPPFNKPSAVPKEFAWPSLLARDGDELETHYRHVLESLGKQKGMLGVIFRKAQNKIQDPAKLRRLIVDLIDKEQWSSLSADVKGDAYEGLLQKNAEDVKGGAGQYFTPRPLIAAMVDAVAPQPDQTICDPACGTGGFLLATHDYLAKHYQLDRAQKKKLRNGTLFGIELVDSVTRLCAMNLLLHGIGETDTGPMPSSGGKDAASGDAAYNLPVVTKDALAGKHGEYEIVLANPPFGKKSSVTIINEAGEQQKESLVINREDFWASTSDKQLNFLQHIFTILKQHGRAAVVLPGNVLFEGGAGETIRRELLKQADVHTLLRLPTGIFYAQGVKANALFFDRKPAREQPWTERLWIYDLRTNKHFTLKENALQRADLEDFVKCYNPKNRHDRKESERFKGFAYDDLLKRDKVNLDIFWLKDESLEDSANLPAPHVIAEEIAEDLEAALAQFAEIAEDLK
ncbi:MAG TPA: class I SAM-dependent DNA methyltransferase [Verrucomicrobiota bacterium]|nr:class I SAM-dependent DNA methyltransferase [Verrucomicrobiota bacterium]HQB15599.1 class I SAM-dependent DNA methyltransferase [Verrucomicrobiota bacterium]